ncbi:MAG: cysteine desulfurase [Bacteroidetes bacterium]|nr:cysteine desulfurase [Bacteroidota bacterium]
METPTPYNKRVYLDNAATTPMDERVFEAMKPLLITHFGNPSSIHAEGRKAKSILEQSRKTIASLLKVSASEIIFTSGGTEADNTAIRMSVKSLGVKNIITSPIEHHAVLHTIEELEQEGVIKMHLLNVDSKGKINAAELEEKVSVLPHCLVSLMHGNNEIGTINDIAAIGNICKQYNALFHTDTVQTMGHFPMDFNTLNIDFAAGSAHKFNGPKGVGFLYVAKKNKIAPMLTGGGQERGHRAGTENIAGIAGMAKALDLSIAELEKDKVKIENLKAQLKQELINHFEGIEFMGDTENALYTVLNVSFPPILPSDLFLFQLDLHGISVSAGSACASGANQGSHVLQAIGAKHDRNYIRFSFGKFNEAEELKIVIDRIYKIFQEQQS